MVNSHWADGGTSAAKDNPEPENHHAPADTESAEEPIVEVKRAVICALLTRLTEQGLISKSTNQKAFDLVHLRVDFPRFFRYPVCSTEEAG